jgi:hypothetical protein
MTLVFKYVTAGTLGGIFLGASFLGIANRFVRKKADTIDKSQKKDHENDGMSSEDFTILETISNDVNISSERAQNPPFTLGNTFVVCGVLFAFLAIGNIRFYQMWRARHSNNRFDADAFQRGFDRFMNEKAYETRKGEGPVNFPASQPARHSALTAGRRRRRPGARAREIPPGHRAVLEGLRLGV